MKIRALLTLAWIASALTLFAAPPQADVQRFSATLSPAESAQAGLTRLSSDQLAVLDALVRHDVALAAKPVEPRTAQFSQRLSGDERQNAGLTQLTAPELSQLDHDVEQFINPTPAAPAAGLDATTDKTSLTSVQIRREAEIHGSFSFTVGVGSHGYSEYGGAMNLSLTDPQHHLAIDFGYAELHSSGGYGSRWCANRGLGPLP